MDRYTPKLNKISQATERMRRRVERTQKSMNKMSTGMKRFGESAASVQGAIAGLGLGLFIKDVFQTGISFEAAMNKVKAISGATGQVFDKLKQQAKDMGAATIFTASQAANAQTFLAMAGLSTENIYKALPGVLALAAAGNMDLATAADLATNVLTGMGLEVADLSRVNDVLASAAAGANATVEELGQAMKFAAPVAGRLNQDIEVTTAVLGAMANAGIKGTMAGRTMRMSMLKLVKPTKDVHIGLRRMGIRLKDLQDGEGGLIPMTQILAKLAEKGMTAAQAAMIFGTEAVSGMMGAIAGGSDALLEMEQRLRDSTGAAQRMADVMQEGAPGATKRFASALEAVKIALAQSVMPAVTAFLNGLASVLRWISKLDPGLLGFIVTAVTFGTVLLSLVVIGGILASALGSLFAVLATISAPILMIVGAVWAAGMAFTFWLNTNNPLVKQLGDILGLIGGLFSPLLELAGFSSDAAGALDLISWSLTKIGEIIALVLVPVKALLQALISVIHAAAAVARLDFSGAFSALQAGGEGIIQTALEGLDIGAGIVGIDTGGLANQAAATRAEVGRQQLEVRGSVDLGLDDRLTGPTRIPLNTGSSTEGLAVPF